MGKKQNNTLKFITTHTQYGDDAKKTQKQPQTKTHLALK